MKRDEVQGFERPKKEGDDLVTVFRWDDEEEELRLEIRLEALTR